jgi:FlaA1/EpsC-like NDP-sugar epimerase
MSVDVDVLSRSQKRWLMMAADASMIAFAFLLSFSLTGGNLWSVENPVWFWGMVAGIMLLGVATFAWQRVYPPLNLPRWFLRAMTRDAYWRIVRGVASLSVVLSLFLFLMGNAVVPESTPLAFFFISLVAVASIRLFPLRSFLSSMTRINTKKHAIVYGAGNTGTRLANALRHGDEYEPVAFLDDDPTLHGFVIHGCRVHSPSEVGNLINLKEASKVFLAFPNASEARRQQIVSHLRQYKVEIATIPTVSELIGGFAKIDQLKEIKDKDLLQREPVVAIEKLAEHSIRDKSVAVTGGGGSIGSELCRQILALNPKHLVVYELSELNLYRISRELEEISNSMPKQIPIYAVLGSVCDKNHLTATLRQHQVQTLMHAAAYKHVPIVENNILSAITNNVQGSKIVAESAAETGVERVILISTDKAVRPTNVMGTTKRIAEQVFQGAQNKFPNTMFSMVRFGNVINSSGSVIPLFRKQIGDFGPVTVTHPEITRFFMTIPEAAELVIQAASMAEGGDVFLLDMGEPVRIADLARRMIELSGLKVKDENNPDGDIEIVYTGLRPGEKLYEELLIDSTALPTMHPKIMRGREKGWCGEKFDSILRNLFDCVEARDPVSAVQLLQIAVPEYIPDTGASLGHLDSANQMLGRGEKGRLTLEADHISERSHRRHEGKCHKEVDRRAQVFAENPI